MRYIKGLGTRLGLIKKFLLESENKVQNGHNNTTVFSMSTIHCVHIFNFIIGGGGGERLGFGEKGNPGPLCISNLCFAYTIKPLLSGRLGII